MNRFQYTLPNAIINLILRCTLHFTGTDWLSIAYCINVYTYTYTYIYIHIYIYYCTIYTCTCSSHVSIDPDLFILLLKRHILTKSVYQFTVLKLFGFELGRRWTGEETDKETNKSGMKDKGTKESILPCCYFG